MALEITAAEKKVTPAQKILLSTLYGLIILLVIFSIMAIQNVGEEGYHQCVEQKCQKRGVDFCSKTRELENCCAGAGGSLSTNQLSGDLTRAACRFY